MYVIKQDMSPCLSELICYTVLHSMFIWRNRIDTCDGLPYRPVGICLYTCMILKLSNFTKVCFNKHKTREKMCVCGLVLVIPCYMFSMMPAWNSYVRYFMVLAYLFQAVKMLTTIFSVKKSKCHLLVKRS